MYHDTTEKGNKIINTKEGGRASYKFKERIGIFEKASGCLGGTLQSSKLTLLSH